MSLFSDYNAGDILWLGDWSLAWIATLGVLGLFILALSAYDLAPLSRKKRWTLLFLRATVYTLAVLLLLEPAVDLKNVSKVKNQVVVLVDQSRSMSLGSDDTQITRYKRAVDFLDDYNTFKTKHQGDHEFHLMGFGKKTSKLTQETLKTHPLEDDASEMTAAIEGLEKQLAGKDLGGIILVTDGIDTGAMGKRTKPGELLDALSIEKLKSLDVPINTFSVASAKNIKDLAILKVLHDDFAFVHNKISIDVEVQAIGVDPQILDVSLFREGKRLQTKQLSIMEGKSQYKLSFELVPRRLGKEIYTVQLPTLKNETLAQNNQTSFLLRVIRDKVRVLQVVGRPSWDERFMRRLLKKNPNVDLISFFILRTSGNIQRVPTDEMSLIPFPTRELFEDELGSFDLIIFQNFNFGPYNMRRYLPQIAKFVKEGGGFVMIGGDLSFASGGYAQTPIEEILPVVLPPTTNPEAVINLEKFHPKLTTAGQQHPITQLAFDPRANEDIWAKLPQQHGTNIVMEAKPGATVLATHPTLTNRGKPMPVIAVSELEKGRVMALTTDSSWRWAFESVGQDGTPREYQLFWNNTIRWLIKDPELKLVKIELTQDTFTPSQEVSVVVRVAKPDYAPAKNVSGTLYVKHQDLTLKKGNSDDKPTQARLVKTIKFKTDGQGKSLIKLPVKQPGAYHLRAVVKNKTGELEDINTLLVVPNTQEFGNIVPREKLLKSIAKQTGGHSASLPSGQLDDSKMAPPRMVQINRRKVIQVWDSWFMFLIILIVLGFEWTLRRRWGRL